MGYFKWFFNFGKKYRKLEAEYDDDNKKLSPIWNFIKLIIIASLPFLALWGMFEIPWADTMWIFKIICGIAAFTLIAKAPTELAVFGVVAFRHALKNRVMKKLDSAQVVQETESALGTEIITKKDYKKWHFVADIIIGVLSLILSVGVIVGFIFMLFYPIYRL